MKLHYNLNLSTSVVAVMGALVRLRSATANDVIAHIATVTSLELTASNVTNILNRLVDGERAEKNGLGNKKQSRVYSLTKMGRIEYNRYHKQLADLTAYCGHSIELEANSEAASKKVVQLKRAGRQKAGGASATPNISQGSRGLT